MADAHVGAMVQRRIAEQPSEPAIRRRVNGTYADVSWGELGKRMNNIASGILTAMDIEDRAAIAILGNTSDDWIACDFACLSVGLRTIPIYASLLPEEVGYCHVDTGTVLSIVEDGVQLEKVRAMRAGFTFFDTKYTPDQVTLKRIVVMNTDGIEPADDWESLADLEARGAEKLAETAEDRKRRGDAVGRTDVCTYTYTSGTTGPQKGVIQTNENMLSMIENIADTGMFDESVREGGLFLFLPLAHSFGRLIEFSSPFFGAPIVISGIPTLGDDLKDSRPGFIPAAPRVYEKMKAKIETAVAGASPTRQRLFHWAINTGKETIPYTSMGKPLPFFLGLRFGFADRLVLSKLRGRLGMDRAGTLLSGSAPLNPDVHAFFLACGLQLLEAYGLTETCPGLTGNQPGLLKIGTVGPALPGVTIKIAEDGEILAKGPNITSGYLNRPEATAEAFNDEGWFLTGDLGSIDDDGFVKITGRKKELIKTSGGKYVAPNKIEGRLKNHVLIQESVVIGDTRNYCTTLIAIDVEELEPWAAARGVPNDPHSDAVRAEVQKHMDDVNSGLASFETIKYFELVPEPMTIENGLLTASMKVKRKVVVDRYADLVESMYAGKKRA